MPQTSIDLQDGALAFRTPYSTGLVEQLKAQIPATDRRWDGTKRLWLVTPEHGPKLQAMAKAFFGESPALPAVGVLNTAPATRILDVRYLARLKRHGNEDSAFAWVNGKWSAIFTKAALFEWFGQTARPGEERTLYAVMGLPTTAAAGDIKSAWKRLARQWHPDTCKEPDAASQFRAIKEAYDVLNDDGKRARYDAGLALEALANRPQYNLDENFMTLAPSVSVVEWAPPLRCGYVMAEGVERVGWFVVSRIYSWQDIIRADGCVLVSAWPLGADKPLEEWVTA